MVAGPEVSCLVAVYETVSVVKDDKNGGRYHEQTMCAEKSFHKKVKSFSDVLKEMGNPFQEESANLQVLDTNDVADPVLASTIGTFHQRGKCQFLSFTDRLAKTPEVHSVSQLRRILFPTLNTSQSNTEATKKNPER